MNAFCQSMIDSAYPFESRIADNFTVPYDAHIDSLVWWGGYWSMATNQIVDFQIEFYEDSTGYQQPKQEPIHAKRIAFSEIDLGGYYRYEASIPQFTILGSQVYWIAFIAHLIWPPHWGNNCSWPNNSPGWGDGQECYFKSGLFGYDLWVSASTVFSEPYESSYQIFGSPGGIEEDQNIPDQHTPWLLKANQNPVTDNSVVLTYNIIRNGHVSLRVFDCTGRHIKTILTSNHSVGIKTIVWDIKNESYASVQNGTYFILLETETTRDILKLVILR
ncbi:MAG: hypothetical protein WBB37_09055 [bacterium]